MQYKGLFAAMTAAVALLAGLADAQDNERKAPANAAVAAGAVEEFRGHTVPSKSAGYSLRMGDVAWEVNVKRGDRVVAGQVLAVVDDREEQARMALLKAEAESLVAINYAKKARDVKKVEYDRVKKMFDNGAVASELELLRAEAEWQLAELDVQKAEHEHTQNQRKVTLQEATLERMRILSKFDGIVEEVNVKEGEVVDPQKPAITVVKNDPLEVEVAIKSAVSLTLKKGDVLEVVYEGSIQPEKAKIIYSSPVVDAGSDKQKIRLELPNPDGKPAGLRVTVMVPMRVVQK